MRCEKTFIESSPGTRLRVRVYQPELPSSAFRCPVILVHGLLNSSEVFDVPHLGSLNFVHTLVKEGFSVYTYDLRGCGDSSSVDWNFGLAENSFIDLPAVVRFCLRHSGSGKVCLGGYSLGGLIIYCFYTYLCQVSDGPLGLKPDRVARIFTLASPAVFLPRTGRWKHMFTRGRQMLDRAGPFIERNYFIHGQIFIRSPLLSRLISLASVNLSLRFAQRNLWAARLIKSIPVPSFLFESSDFDAATFLHIIRSKVLDRTSTRLIVELLKSGAHRGSIEIEAGNHKIELPDDFQDWLDVPLLLVSSDRDELVRTSEVDAVHHGVRSSVHFNVDRAIGQGCGHAGYIFKAGVTWKIRSRILQFLNEA